MRPRRLATLSAPVGVAVAATGIAVAALLTPLDPLTQAISELGAPDAPYSAVMNTAFIVGGAVSLPFAVLLVSKARNVYETAGAALWVHGTGETLAGETRRGLAAVWLGNFNALVWASWAGWRVYAPGLALPEALGVSAFVVWILATAYRFYNYKA